MATKKDQEKTDAIATVETPSTALIPNLPLALTAEHSSSISELVSENLGAGATLNLSDLKRIKIPAGGITQFEIPNVLTGESDYVKELYGVVIGHKVGKAFWAREYGSDGSTGTPPDCRSDDGIHGIGNPNPDNNQDFHIAQDEFGYLCETCPNNEYGTARGGEGAGKACKDLRFMFFFSGDALLPQVIVAPPTSLKPMKDYFLGLINNGMIVRNVITKFELTKQTNKGGIAYAQLKATVHKQLDPESAKQAKKFSDLFAPMIGTVINTIMQDGTVYEATTAEPKDGFK